MHEITATEAARHFASVLDAVERGEQFTILRRGEAVARLSPIRSGRGAEVKALFRCRSVDAAWIEDVYNSRAALDSGNTS